jgi:hypothetical protein
MRFTRLASELNALLDEGKSITIDEAHQGIEDRSLFVRLQELGADVSSYRDEDERRTILNMFASLSATADGKRKFGVSRNGLALWLAYCLQILQRPGRDNYGSDDYPFPPGTSVPGYQPSASAPEHGRPS